MYGSETWTIKKTELGMFREVVMQKDREKKIDRRNMKRGCTENNRRLEEFHEDV